jgi:hypothetical protein
MKMGIDLNSITIDPVVTRGVTDFSGDPKRFINTLTPIAPIAVLNTMIEVGKITLKATDNLQKARELKDRFLNAPGYYAGQAGGAVRRTLTKSKGKLN